MTALVLVTVIILGAFKIRMAQRSGSHALRPGFLPVKEKVTLPARSESEDLFEKDDKNPDVIPSNKGKIYYVCLMCIKTICYGNAGVVRLAGLSGPVNLTLTNQAIKKALDYAVAGDKLLLISVLFFVSCM